LETEDQFDIKLEAGMGKPSPKMSNRHNNIPFIPLRNAKNKKMAKQVKD